jgi:hypothetical protein
MVRLDLQFQNIRFKNNNLKNANFKDVVKCLVNSLFSL